MKRLIISTVLLLLAASPTLAKEKRYDIWCPSTNEPEQALLITNPSMTPERVRNLADLKDYIIKLTHCTIQVEGSNTTGILVQFEDPNIYLPDIKDGMSGRGISAVVVDLQQSKEERGD